MKTLITILTIAIAIPAVANAHGPEKPWPFPRPAAGVDGKPVLYKDPLVASYLSATLPGLGQAYVGKKARGFAFFVGVVGALGSAYAFYEPAELDLADYDRTLYGGDGDGLLNTDEIRNWEGRKADGDAFSSLSTRRKVGAITSAAVGVGIYIWNILDARGQAREHNRVLAQRRIDLGLQANNGRPGLALNLRF